MRYLLVLAFILFASCQSQIRFIGTRPLCNQDSIKLYAKDCIGGVDTLTIGGQYERDACLRDAYKLYCKKVWVVAYKGKIYECPDLPKEYKYLCKCPCKQ